MIGVIGWYLPEYPHRITADSDVCAQWHRDGEKVAAVYATPAQDAAGLVEALKEASQYLDSSNLNSIAAGSTCHRKMHAALAAYKEGAKQPSIEDHDQELLAFTAYLNEEVTTTKHRDSTRAHPRHYDYTVYEEMIAKDAWFARAALAACKAGAK